MMVVTSILWGNYKQIKTGIILMAAFLLLKPNGFLHFFLLSQNQNNCSMQDKITYKVTIS